MTADGMAAMSCPRAGCPSDSAEVFLLPEHRGVRFVCFVCHAVTEELWYRETPNPEEDPR